jgi:hypothetical protein
MRHDIAPIRYFFFVEDDFFDDGLALDFPVAFFEPAFAVFVLAFWVVELLAAELFLLGAAFFSAFFVAGFFVVAFFAAGFAVDFAFGAAAFFFEAVVLGAAAGVSLVADFLAGAAPTLIPSIATRV